MNMQHPDLATQLAPLAKKVEEEKKKSRFLAPNGVQNIISVIKMYGDGNIASVAEELGYTAGGLAGVLKSEECDLTLSLACEAVLRRGYLHQPGDAVGTYIPPEGKLPEVEPVYKPKDKVIISLGVPKDHEKSIKAFMQEFKFERLAEGDFIIIGPAKQCSAMTGILRVLNAEFSIIEGA